MVEAQWEEQSMKDPDFIPGLCGRLLKQLLQFS